MTVKSWTYIKKGFLIPAADVRYTNNELDFWIWRHFEKKALWKGRHFEKKTLCKKRSSWLTSNLNIDHQGKTNSHLA